MVKGVPKELLTKVRNKTFIEKVGSDCEETVIRELIRGKNIPQIVRILSKKWVDYDFTYDKVRAFIQKNAEITKLVAKIDWKVAKRQAELNINYQEKLFKLIEVGEKRLETMQKEGCTDVDFFRGLKGNIQALYAHRKILGGPIGAPSRNVNINIIQQISASKQDLRTKVLQAKMVIPDKPLDFMDIDAELEEEEEKYEN